ncbi:uncharacterized protein B0H18DRAFT_1009284, partial [Fomitopsis serialis]|uniref:uncharacterized protein n=1 Tax=Fomitopsis serialis TaxID=139415 RepID=UPI0020079D27
MTISSRTSCDTRRPAAGTLGHSQPPNSQMHLDHSKHPPSLSYQNPLNRGITASSKISPFLAHLPLLYLILPSIPSLILTDFRVHGVLLPPSVSSSGDFPQALRQPLATSRRHIAQSRYTRVSGQQGSYAQARTSTMLTRASHLGRVHRQVDTASLPTLVRISSAQRAWVRCRNGWTTTSWYGSYAFISTSTTVGVLDGTGRSHEKAAITLEADCGTVVSYLRMAPLTSSTRTAAIPFATSHLAPQGQQQTNNTAITSPTWTSFLAHSESPGSPPKIPTSEQLRFSQGSSGMFRRSPSRCPRGKRRSISQPLAIGEMLRAGHTHSQTYKESMENCSTPRWWFPVDEHISQVLKPCFESAVTVLSCRIPPLDLSLLTSYGGHRRYSNLSSDEPYPPQLLSSTSPLSRTPAPASASALRLATTGVHGGSYQAGRLSTESATLVGQKQWGSSSSHAASQLREAQADICGSMETTLGSWKVGETAEAVMRPSTASSNVSSSTLTSS